MLLEGGSWGTFSPPLHASWRVAAGGLFPLRPNVFNFWDILFLHPPLRDATPLKTKEKKIKKKEKESQSDRHFQIVVRCHCVEVRPIDAVMHPLQLCPMSVSRRQMAVGKTPALRADFESSGTMTVCKALLLLFSVVSAHHTDVRTQTRDQNHSDGICVIKLDTPHYPRDKVLCSFLVWYRRTSLPHNR